MTVSTTLNKVTIAGNGATTSFPFNFAMPGVSVAQASAFLVVTVVNSLGVATVISFGPGSSQYQLSLNAPISPSPTPVGGVVSYNPLGAPIPTGSTLTIQRILPENQLTSLSGQATLWQTVIESSLDYLTMTVQQLQGLFGNFFQAPQTDPVGLNYTLPPAAQRANLAFIFDGSGNATAGAAANVAVSAPMIPVVQAASIPIARSALGLGAMATEGIGAALQDDGAGNVRVFFGVNKLNITTSITSANFLQKIKATGPITLNLPRANTLWAGFGFWLEVLQASAGVVTLTPNAADQIESFGSGVSITISPGDSLFISTDGATNAIWYIEFNQGNTANSTPAGVYGSGLAIDVTSNTTATAVAPGGVSVSDGINFYTTIPTGGINTAVVGAGGLDTGALAANSNYKVWVIYNPISQVGNWLISLQTTFAGLKPNLPAGFTAAGLVGTLRTQVAAANLAVTKQRGKKVRYTASQIIVTSAAGALGNPATPTWLQTGNVSPAIPTLANYVPPSAISVTVGASVSSSTTGIILIAPNSSYGNNNSITNPAPLQVGGSTSGSIQTNQIADILLETSQISIASSATTNSAIFVYGWDEP